MEWITVISLIIASLALLLSMSNIRVSMFKERYNIYFEARKLFLKLENSWDSIDATKQDLLNIETLLQKAEFMFGNDEDISTLLNELQNLLNYYVENNLNTLMAESQKPPGNMSSEMLIEITNKHKENLENLRRKIKDKEIEEIFRYHLSISYNPLSVINWKRIKKWLCKKIRCK